MRTKVFRIKPHVDRTVNCVCCDPKRGHVYALDGSDRAADWVQDVIYEIAKYGGAVSISVTPQNKRLKPTADQPGAEHDG